MNDICMETPNCDWDVKCDEKKGSLEKQIENIERLTRILNSSVENTQFEDDDYYYYVKAVPKVMGGAQRKAARREQPSPRPQQKRTTSSGSGAQRSRSAAKEDSVTGSTR